MADHDEIAAPDIAIIGLAAHLPGAGNIAQFWENLSGGVESIRALSAEDLENAGVAESLVRHPDYVRSGAPLGNLDRFDAGFFGMSPKEAAIMDPQQRHFLECAWEAMEHAGYPPGAFQGPVGVFAGSGPNSYLIYNLLSDPELVEREGIFLLRHTGNDKDVLATRVSYQMNLRGPSINVQTACSTSLVAVHLACQSLLNQECDLALAGASSIELPHAIGYLYRESEILSRDGHCRAFDAQATGTVFGSGSGAVVLRRLRDAIGAGDAIHAVIKGSAINNDGSRKVGYLAPSVEGQIDVVSEALAVAGVDPCSVDYVEAHGTGTSVGDPIELTALGQVFGQRERKLAVGSVKTNIGHLDTAAGMAGLIKTVLALHHRQLPPTLHFRTPNPRVDFDRMNVRVVDRLEEWTRVDGPRRAGVTSLGIGGTNAHVVLEEAPEVARQPSHRSVALLTLSARSAAALDAAAGNLARRLALDTDALDDVAYTLHVGRSAFAHRRAVVSTDSAEAVRALESNDAASVWSGTAPTAPRPVAFLFTGQGSQYVSAGRTLYATEPVFRRWLDECAVLARPHVSLDIRDILYPANAGAAEATEAIRQTWNTQPILFALEYALAQMWMSWGIRPARVIGHSIGEYVAACIAGVFTLEDALSVVSQRGLLMRELEGGSMLAVGLPEKEVAALATGSVSLAAVNAPDQCVLSGPSAEIDPIERALVARGVPAQRLRTSHAFHSRMMEPVLDRFTEIVRRASLSAPRIPILSNVSGAALSDADATDPAYWARHLRQAVRFGDGVATLLAEPDIALLEIGPGDTLAGLSRLHPAHDARQPIFSSLPRFGEAERDAVHVQATLGRLWVCGAPVDWRGYHAHEHRRRVPLPTYPFERQRHWLGPRGVGATAGVPASVDRWMQRRTWSRSAPPATATATGRWLIYTDAGGIGQALADALRRQSVPVTTVALGDAFAPSGSDGFVLDPASDADHDALIARLVARDWPSTVVHLWALDERGAAEDRCFHSLRALMKGLGQRAAGRAASIAAVSRCSVSVAGELVLEPTGALLGGPVRVAPQEYQELHCRQIDVDSATPEAIARLLIAEMSQASTERLIAYRDGVRWREGFARRRLESGASRLRRQGVYLVTGGTGGLGSAVADWLARSYAARLILVSRDAESMAAAHAVRTAEWEKSGAEVLFCSANVTDKTAMQQAIARGRERFGELHGVVHAAGVLDDGVIELKTRESANRVMAPKVHGVRVLDELLHAHPLDFFALFSSVSSAIPPAGQVDYCSANAYLDAFAESCPPERHVIAIGWGPWAETGMAARGGASSATSAIRHPLLDRLEHHRGTVATYAGALSLDRHWIVREHRFHGGDALFPGTGHLDVAVSAAWQTLGQAPVVLRDVVFLAPLRVAPGSAHPFRAELTRTDGGYRFAIADEQSKFVTGFCGRSESGARRVDLTSLLRRCAQGEILQPVNVRQNGHFDFGPRWHNLQRIAFGDGECLATLELPAEYHDEAKEFSLHPALLDMATGAAMFLVPGFDRPGDLLLPFSYTRMEVFGQLPPRVYSHARMRPTTGADLLSFDITVADEHGAVLVEVEEFTVKRLAGVAGVAASAPSAARDTPRSDERPAARPPRIATSDGLTALRQILSAKSHGVVFVSPAELQSEPEPAPPASPATTTVAVEGDVERALAAMWQRLLGLEHVESSTDFFAAGGHSLIAVRLFAEIRKRFGVDLGLSTLFEARTLGALASLIRAAQQPSVSKPTSSRPPGLVSIRAGGAKPPLFLLHNIGGRALIYEALARYVPADQPLFGIEALGFHGSYPDHSVPEMATHYIALMRAVQPDGPYFVAGHSFGGVVAYEIGRQLLAQGQQVGMIGILDTLLREAPSTVAALPSTAATTKRRLRSLLFGEGRREFLTVAIASRARKLVQYAYRQTHRALQGRGRRVPSLMRSVEQACWVASHDYSPPRSDARILLFRCQLRSRWDHPDFLMGWGEVAAGGVDVCEVPGDHLSMVSAPGVEVVATRLAAVITRVSGAAPPPTGATVPAPGDATMNIIGISGLERAVAFKRRQWPSLEEREYRISQGHDAAAALVCAGAIVSAAAEERFDRRKHSPHFPVQAIQWCLADAGLSLSEVDAIVHGFDYAPYRELYSLDPTTAELYATVLSHEALLEQVARDLPGFPLERVHHVSHHTAHAASAFYSSGWEDCLVLVVDAMGEAHGVSAFAGRHGQLEHLRSYTAQDSIGIFYSLVTLHLGFDFNSDEYKIMGLAPYGDPGRYRAFFEREIVLRDDGSIRIPSLRLNRTRDERENYTATRAYLSEHLIPARQPDADVSVEHRDIAAALQARLGDALQHLCAGLRSQTGLTRLAMAGGVALNCTANGHLLRSGLFEDIYIQPAAGDDGTALGAALHHSAVNGEIVNTRLPVPLLGPSYDRGAIDRALAEASALVRVRRFDDADQTCAAAAELIARGAVLGWYRGRMEYGPRALGNRSILADPGHPEMRDRINAMVKKREAFRPFAPAVSLEQVHRWFDVAPGTRLPYMIAVVDVREEWRSALPAITHVNGSARVQTVSAEDNPAFHQLLRHVGLATGREMVLNTSFNVKGQPIVNTPAEAISTFLGTGIDCIFLDDCLVERA